MGRNDAKVKLKLPGINKLLKSVQPKLDQVGEEIATDAGPGYRYVPNEHHRTARGHIEPESLEVARRDAETNDLLKAVGHNIR